MPRVADFVLLCWVGIGLGLVKNGRSGVSEPGEGGTGEKMALAWS